MSFKMNWKINYKIAGGAATASTVVVIALVLCFFISPDTSARVINISILVTAASLGWLLGVSISPYDANERKQFSQYSKAVVTFISGYVAAKLDKLIDSLVAPAALADPVFGFRLLSFASVLIVSMLVTFIFREYAD
jgi:hypothetical protein